MKEVVRITQLIDFYGSLLTKKQQDNLIDYYFNDLTFEEIGEKYNISKNAIYDSIKKSIYELEQYDSKLKLIDGFNLRMKIYSEINIDDKTKSKLLLTEVVNYGKKYK